MSKYCNNGLCSCPRSHIHIWILLVRLDAPLCKAQGLTREWSWYSLKKHPRPFWYRSWLAGGRGDGIPHQQFELTYKMSLSYSLSERGFTVNQCCPVGIILFPLPTCKGHGNFWDFLFFLHNQVVGFHCQLVGGDQGCCSVPSSTQACSAQRRCIRCNVSTSYLEIPQFEQGGMEWKREGKSEAFIFGVWRVLSLFLMMQITLGSVVKTKPKQYQRV